MDQLNKCANPHSHQSKDALRIKLLMDIQNLLKPSTYSIMWYINAVEDIKNLIDINPAIKENLDASIIELYRTVYEKLTALKLTIESVDSNLLSIAYLKLILSLLEQFRIINLQNQFNTFPQHIKDTPNVLQAAYLKHFRDHKPNVSNFLNMLKNLSCFDVVRVIQGNIVMVGANGSGKSTFSRTLKECFGDNMVIIGAQKILVYPGTADISLSKSTLKAFRKTQSDPKLYKENLAHAHTKSVELFSELIKALRTDHIQRAFASFQIKKDKKVKESSVLEITCKIWNKVINHRKIEISSESCELIVCSQNEEEQYSFARSSDGEKAIFYYIGNIILAEQGSYIIVDEPENHLHAAVVLRLWDELEKARPDCQFVYLTHDLQFATSRFTAQKIWMKSYRAPNQWDMQIIPESDIPEALFVELLGSRRKILFCEGERSSLDYQIYSALFNEYTVVPAKGHLNVCNYTQTFNEQNELHSNNAVGIIDGDCHHLEFIEKWRGKNVYCLPLAEVENILCDEMLLSLCANAFKSDDSAVSEAKNLLIQQLEAKKEQYSLLYTRDVMNNRLKECLVQRINDLNDLLTQLRQLALEQKAKEIYDERKLFLESIVTGNDYQKALSVIADKGLLDKIGKRIVPDYRKRAVRFLQTSPDVCKNLRKKYFLDLS